MQFYSTKHESPNVDLEEAVMKSQPADKGLYMPEVITPLPASFFEEIENLSFAEMAYQVAHTLLQDSIEADALQKIVADTLQFDAPLQPVHDNIACLELFHGPTLAFKDFGAQFMARLMGHFVQGNTEKQYVLVATSGDTGGAVARGFYQVPNIEVIILYPSGKVSDLQEKQLTTLGHNISALEINGTFDNCQALVKTAFNDADLNQKMKLASANSISLARLIPQMFYYFRAYQLLKDKSKPMIVCVPSGNFGNITAGLIAKRMGLPIAKFIAATNANRVFPDFLQTEEYTPINPSIATYSNAMDVGNPSNFQRIIDLYGGDIEAIRKDIFACSYNDDETLETLKAVHDEYGYEMCPHTAIAYRGLMEYLNANALTDNCNGIFLATAHPSKFLDIVEQTIGTSIEIPHDLAVLKDKEKVARKMEVDFEAFKEYLMNCIIS
ncbi:MAG: threonine synthase [Chitinophagales bacterium]